MRSRFFSEKGKEGEHPLFAFASFCFRLVVMTKLEQAEELLKKDNCTLVLVGPDEVIEDHERGVRPLLKWVGKRTFESCAAADKVIGKGAAFLYALLQIKEVSTNVISKPALAVMDRYGIKVHYETLVERIYNHSHTGYCPIEEAVEDVSTPEEALPKIKERLRSLRD